MTRPLPLQLLPRAFYPDGEENAFLRRFKTSKLAKWRLTNAASLKEIAYLGFYLSALGRDEEALEVVREPAETVKFTGDWLFWVGPGTCIGWMYLIRLKQGRKDEANHW